MFIHVTKCSHDLSRFVVSTATAAWVAGKMATNLGRNTLGGSQHVAMFCSWKDRNMSSNVVIGATTRDLWALLILFISSLFTGLYHRSRVATVCDLFQLLCFTSYGRLPAWSKANTQLQSSSIYPKAPRSWTWVCPKNYYKPRLTVSGKNTALELS